MLLPKHAPARFAAVRENLAVWRPALSGNMRQLNSPLCGIISLYGVRRCPATCASSIRRCAASSRCMASGAVRQHAPARFAAVRDHLAVWRPALSGNMRQLDSPLCSFISLYGVRHIPAPSSSAVCKPACTAYTAGAGACSFLKACSSFVHVAVKCKF